MKVQWQVRVPIKYRPQNFGVVNSEDQMITYWRQPNSSKCSKNAKI